MSMVQRWRNTTTFYECTSTIAGTCAKEEKKDLEAHTSAYIFQLNE